MEAALKVELEIPQDILSEARIFRQSANSELTKLVAIELFRENRITLGKACKLTGMSKWEFIRFLREKKIPLHYDAKEFEEDLETIKELNL
ncbi:MAG: UPF0175 family protein [bacterium]